MKILNPKSEPNRWLSAVLRQLVEDDTPESKEILAEAVKQLSMWIEPGLVDDLFAAWIDQYMDLLREYENNRSIDLLTYEPEGPPVAAQ
jgi:hypothetical protein